MIKKILTHGFIILTVLSMSACGGSNCETKEDVADKVKQVSEKLQDVLKSGDMNKIMALSSTAMKIGKFAAVDDPQEACDALDELMDDM